METVVNIGGDIYLSYRFLLDKGVSYNSINNWNRKGRGGELSIIKVKKTAYINYNDIPAPTRSKLPPLAEIRREMRGVESNVEVRNVAIRLGNAMTKAVDYRGYYRDTFGIPSDKALHFAMKRGVWERLLALALEHTTGIRMKKGYLEVLHKAYHKVYPEGYRTKAAFQKAIKLAQEEGVDAVVVDGRVFNTDPRAKKFDERHVYFVRSLVSSGKAYNGTLLRDKVREMCNEAGIAVPSDRWIRYEAEEARKLADIHEARHGSEAAGKLAPYESIQPALYAGNQWQIDGWDIPFYYVAKNTNGKNTLKRLVLIAVRDAHSRRIVGYSIGESENRLTLMDALQDAVGNTGYLPYEVVTDNHSYNLTKEIGYMREEMERIGTKWTVDSNPKRKSIAERGFRTLGDLYCKHHVGYIGQGVKTRDRDGRTKQELMDRYLKATNRLTVDQIRLIAIEAVGKFNRDRRNAAKSPEEVHGESRKPHVFTLDFEERLRVFTKRTEYKVSRGQINITVAGQMYEYQLNAEQYRKYNGKRVGVRYESLDLIYLFDTKTDMAICSLRQKQKAHGALADQTDADIQKFNRHAGMLKGIKAQARKENEDLAARAAELEPRIYEIANKVLTPKNLLQEFRENEDLRRDALARGIDLDRVPDFPTVNENELAAFREPKKTRRERSPFAVDGHRISVIDPNEQ